MASNNINNNNTPLEEEIMKQIIIARKLLVSDQEYRKRGKYEMSDFMRGKKRAIYRRLNKICTHDGQEGRTPPTYQNKGIVMCLRCGNASNSLTNGFVDGWN